MYVGNFVIQKYYGKCCGSFSNSIMGMAWGILLLGNVKNIEMLTNPCIFISQPR